MAAQELSSRETQKGFTQLSVIGFFQEAEEEHEHMAHGVGNIWMSWHMRLLLLPALQAVT
jgi:hypothetical protein